MAETEILALIPARGGSKSIPMKNIDPLAGRPLIAYSIEVAQQCRRISRVIVSMDLEQIRQVSLSCGPEAPFLRPGELAEDNTPDLPSANTRRGNCHRVRSIPADACAAGAAVAGIADLPIPRSGGCSCQ